MLDYCKMILVKVSFHQAVFEKELKKAFISLQTSDKQDLLDWCLQTFVSDKRTLALDIYRQSY